MSRPDLYTILGLLPEATSTEINHAYRALVRRHHPDTRVPQSDERAGASKAMLQQIHDAYAVLRDPIRRADYDQQMSAERPRPAARSSVPFLARAYRTAEPPIKAGPVHWQPSPPRTLP
jgi:molecular chaperone DnaJ